MMSENATTELTLPSIVASLAEGEGRSALIVTVVFHPDTSRIGEYAVLVPESRGGQWVLGRSSPEFVSPAPGQGEPGPTRPLQDRYVSRQALTLVYAGGTLQLLREDRACRCRVGSLDLTTEVCLGPEELRQGVPLVLAHTVVLLLREGPQERPRLSRAEHSTLRGGSAYMASLRTQITQIAGSDQDVLLSGETGTGKELVARAIHQASKRSTRELVSVNMAAIPASLAPSALFGSAKGAFTGADKASAGYFEQAAGGILFLDEIGDTPPEIQAQLLRALQQREIQRIGGPVRRVELRVLAATDAPLDGRSDFKSALRHRLASSELILKPLREHPEDIGELLLGFLETFFAAQGVGNLLPGPDDEPVEVARWAQLFHLFLDYRWPGNIRQLSNCARQVALASQSRMTLPAHLRQELTGEPSASGSGVDAGHNLAQFEKDEFVRALEDAEFEVATAARSLGVSRQAVYRRMADATDLRTAGEIPEAELRAVLAANDGDLADSARALRVSRTALRARLRNVDSAG